MMFSTEIALGSNALKKKLPTTKGTHVTNVADTYANDLHAIKSYILRTLLKLASSEGRSRVLELQNPVVVQRGWARATTCVYRVHDI